jgi:glucan phosphorylase
LKLSDKYVPVKVPVTRGPGQPRWLTKEIKNLLNCKRKAWKIFKREGGPANKQRYDDVSKKVKKLISNAKRRLEKEIAYSPDKNKKKFTNYVKSKTKSRPNIGPIELDGKQLAVDDIDIAEALNKYFVSV